MQHHNNPRTLAPILLAALSCALLLGCTPGASDDGGEGGSGGGGGEAGAGEGGEGGSTDQAGQSGGGQGGQPTGGKGGVGGASVTTVEYGIETRPKNSTCVAPAKAEPGNPDFPKTIRDTGCFRSDDPKVPVEGVIAYDLQAPLWSDAAEKQRWLAVPDGKSITVKEDGDFDFPVGSVLIKTFALEGKTLETRFMFRHADGAWAGYTYVWDTEGKDAVLAGPAASFRFVGNIEWTFPSRDNCLGCHQEASGRTLGPEIAQLNAAFVYPGNRKANQLRTLDHLGLFSKPLGDPSKLKALPKPSDEAASVDARLRAYMHSNCSHCHRPNGVPEVVMDLRFDTPLKGTNLCNVPPAKGSYGVPDARIVTPGNVDLSTIALRVRSLAQNVRMPSLGSVVVDEDGAALLEDWIASLKSCP